MYFVLVLACSPPEGINIEDLGNVNLISRNIQKHLAMIPLPQEVSQLELWGWPCRCWALQWWNGKHGSVILSWFWVTMENVAGHKRWKHIHGNTDCKTDHFSAQFVYLDVTCCNNETTDLVLRSIYFNMNRAHLIFNATISHTRNLDINCFFCKDPTSCYIPLTNLQHYFPSCASRPCNGSRQDGGTVCNWSALKLRGSIEQRELPLWRHHCI